MLFGQQVLSFCILLLVLVVADDNVDPPPGDLKINVQLVDATETNPNYQLKAETPNFDDGRDDKLNLVLYIDPDSLVVRGKPKTICICIKNKEGLENKPTQECSEYSRICFVKNECFGKNKAQIKACPSHYVPMTFNGVDRTYRKFEISIDGNKAFIKAVGGNDVELDIASFALDAPSALQLKQLSIGLIAFYENVNSADCTDEKNEICRHTDLLYLRTTANPNIQPVTSFVSATKKSVIDPNIIVTVAPTPLEQSIAADETSSNSPTSSSPPTASIKDTVTMALYVFISIVIANVIM